MPVIARGMITLSGLNDAFSVSLSPSSRVVKALFDGTVSDGELGNVFTNINVFRGDSPVPFTVDSVTVSSTGVTYAYSTLADGYTTRLWITGISKETTSAEIAIEISVGNDFHTTVNFQFSVVRESTMLDWIQDWSGRRTEIRSESIVTPRAFFGSKTDDGRLNGVYIGPDMAGGNGIYAYKNCPESAFGSSSSYEIFRLNQNGGMIGGWEIDHGRIYKQTVTDDRVGLLELKAEGTLQFTKDTGLAWQFDKSGAGVLAFGNISWNENGDATFAGSITAKEGYIAGWTISENALYNGNVLISSTKSYIGIHAGSPSSYGGEASISRHTEATILSGGVSVFYSSENSYGLRGYAPSTNKYNPIITFSLGDTNKIAGWSFDNEAIWIGDKVNQTRSKTSAINSITIGTSGLRGNTWYIDNDGEISFMDGLLQFSNTGGKIGGWVISQNHISSDYAGLVSHKEHTGLYLTGPTAFNGIYTGYMSHIQTKGGIYLRATKARSELVGISTAAKVEFKLSTSEDNIIGGWKFNSTSIYATQEVNTAGQFAGANNIVISPEGLRGPAWRFEKDGSGAVAGGAISWNQNQVSFGSGVTIGWNLISGYGNRFTKITSEGVYTGTINASQISAGQISADRIDVGSILLNEGKWLLGDDGAGYLASKNITWTKDGELQMTGKITATSGLIGGFQIINKDSESSLETVEDAYADGGYMKIISRGEVAGMFFSSPGFTKYAAVGVPTADSWSSYKVLGLGAIMRLDNRTSGTPNVALALYAENGTQNHAFVGRWSGTLEGIIDGYAAEIVSRSSSDQQLQMTGSNRFFLHGNGTGGFILPLVTSVRSAIRPSGANTEWCVRITIVNMSANTARIKGRVSGGDTSVPRIFNGNTSGVDYIDLEAGDAIEFLLLNAGFGSGYQAWVVSHQR